MKIAAEQKAIQERGLLPWKTKPTNITAELRMA